MSTAETIVNEAPVLDWPAAKFRMVFGACLVASSKDVERPHMCGVHVERANGVLAVVATDGHWLLRWREVEGQTNEKGEPNDRRPFSCLVPRPALESFMAATKGHVELERVTLTLSGDSRELGTIFDVRRHYFTTVTGFPPVDQVIPAHVAPEVSSIGVAAGILQRVAKAFAIAMDDPSTTLFWQMSGGRESPLVCTSPSCEELLAVVMPVRTDGNNALPEQQQSDQETV